MRIYLVRHGQSDWQMAASRELDSHLTPVGHRQSLLLGRWLAGHDMLDRKERLVISELYTSPFHRARETAEAVAGALEIPVLVQHDLCEAEFRVADQLPRWETPLTPPAGYALPGSYKTFQAKTRKALQGLVSRAEVANGPIMAITHGGLIKTLLRLIASTDAVDVRLYNTGISCVEWDGDRWCIVHVNLWDHLPPKMRTL